MSVVFRMCKKEDVAEVIAMIKELASYEKLETAFVGSEEELEKSIFYRKDCEVLLATLEDEIIGYSLFFRNYSTFLCKPGMYIEDLFIREEHRQNGFGLAMFKTLARIANAREYGRIDWSCLKWNEPSLDFYLNKLKAVTQDEWVGLRITDSEIKDLGKIG